MSQFLMTVTFAKAAVIALHCRLDQARRVAVSSLEPILTKADVRWDRRMQWRARLKPDRLRSSSHMTLDRRTNQQPQLVVVHST
jgi:hypothetical protein